MSSPSRQGPSHKREFERVRRREVITAIMVDGGFYSRRAHALFGEKSPAARADELMEYCRRHIRKSGAFPYRIFYYDCPPSSRVVFHPLTRQQVNLGKSSQKGVDMRIGLDIASLAERGLVNQIIMISGDNDFVPAAKHARRSGIDFILDPMWANVADSLNEHVDGVRECVRRPPANTKDPLYELNTPAGVTGDGADPDVDDFEDI